MFHRWFVENLRAVPGRTVYNCTEGGAWIEGMQHRPFAEVRELLREPVDVRGVLDGVIAATDAAGRQRALARKLRANVGHLRRARKLAQHARRLARGDHELELARTERALAASLRPVEFAALLAQREVERALDVASHQAGRGDYLAASTALFDSIAAVAEQLLPILTAAETALEV
jgi:hypothetical protein